MSYGPCAGVAGGRVPVVDLLILDTHVWVGDLVLYFFY